MPDTESILRSRIFTTATFKNSPVSSVFIKTSLIWRKSKLSSLKEAFYQNRFILII